MERLATLFLAAMEETLPPLNFGRELVKMGVGLVLLLGLVYLCTFAIKRLARGRMAAFNGSHTIQILERRPIGPKAVLYLLSLRGKEILIAYTPQGVTPLHPLGTPVHTPSFEQILDEKLHLSP